jgi:hypothetical protein
MKHRGPVLGPAPHAFQRLHLEQYRANPLMITTGEYWLMGVSTAGGCLAKTGAKKPKFLSPNTLSKATRIITPISSRMTTPKISKPAMPINTETADT